MTMSGGSGTLSLNGTWNLLYTDEGYDYYCGPEVVGKALLPARVPAPIHQVLMDAGLLDDPRVGRNSLSARWVEEQFWVYRRTFSVPDHALAQYAWLTFERLEYEALVLLNGEAVGRHANAHLPARWDVSGKLRAGENLLVVVLETGLFASADKPGTEYKNSFLDVLTKRPWHRKPQYQCGWDWQPRLMNVGILGGVTLEWRPGSRLGQVSVFAVPTNDLAQATFTVRAEVENPGASGVDAALTARISETGQQVTLPLRLEPGPSRHEVTLDVASPRLWWPLGHGPQDRYTVEVTLEAGGAVQTQTRQTGVRRVTVDQSPHPVAGRYFILEINNRPVFCKGGNWVPADMLYSTVTPERTQALIQSALDANFNMLRVWGGGVLADETLCDACDEAGVLIWHDLLFACAKYPGDDPAWVAEAHREVTWMVRELAHHPALVVWCGNNEIEWGDWSWGYKDQKPTHPHYALFHRDIPLIVRREDPSTFQWLSSPFSPDLAEPNDPTVGDQHPWTASILRPGGEDGWEYRNYVDRFPNEGGVFGASSPATLRQFLPESERAVLSPAWEHHDNTFAIRSADQGVLGQAYETVRLWTGRDSWNDDWESHAFVSASLQAEGLTEYITNYRRRMFSSAAAVFWMFNDSWPATHGWTIVDYYGRRKLAYHPVRRAFQPITVVVTDEGDRVTVYGVNDTPLDWQGNLRWGLFALAGGLSLDEAAPATLPANASTPLAQMDRARWLSLGVNRTGAFALLSDGEGRPVAQHRLLLARFKDLELPTPDIQMVQQDGALTLTSPTFAWGVCLDLDGERPLADNCLDLLPSIPYVLPWAESLGPAKVMGWNGVRASA